MHEAPHIEDFKSDIEFALSRLDSDDVNRYIEEFAEGAREMKEESLAHLDARFNSGELSDDEYDMSYIAIEQDYDEDRKAIGEAIKEAYETGHITISQGLTDDLRQMDDDRLISQYAGESLGSLYARQNADVLFSHEAKDYPEVDLSAYARHDGQLFSHEDTIYKAKEEAQATRKVPVPSEEQLEGDSQQSPIEGLKEEFAKLRGEKKASAEYNGPEF